MSPGSPGPVPVEIHTLSGCAHCARALSLLRRRGIPFTQVSGDGRPGFREELLRITGRSTVPQILIGGTPVGGASDLVRLDRRGILGPLVAGSPFPVAVVRRRFSPLGLLSGMLGGGCGPWRHRVELVERDGTVARRIPATGATAAALADALNGGEAAQGTGDPA